MYCENQLRRWMPFENVAHYDRYLVEHEGDFQMAYHAFSVTVQSGHPAFSDVVISDDDVVCCDSDDEDEAVDSGDKSGLFKEAWMFMSSNHNGEFEQPLSVDPNYDWHGGRETFTQEEIFAIEAPGNWLQKEAAACKNGEFVLRIPPRAVCRYTAAFWRTKTCS
jgi:hypothetical protein